MTRIERVLVLGAIIYCAFYMMCFFVAALHGQFPAAMVAFHFLCMFFNLVALVLTIRDLYLREFASENAKVTWALLIVLTGGVGWLVYVFKHALKPRHRRGEAVSGG